MHAPESEITLGLWTRLERERWVRHLANQDLGEHEIAELVGWDVDSVRSCIADASSDDEGRAD